MPILLSYSYQNLFTDSESFYLDRLEKKKKGGNWIRKYCIVFWFQKSRVHTSYASFKKIDSQLIILVIFYNFLFPRHFQQPYRKKKIWLTKIYLAWKKVALFLISMNPKISKQIYNLVLFYDLFSNETKTKCQLSIL